MLGQRKPLVRPPALSFYFILFSFFINLRRFDDEFHEVISVYVATGWMAEERFHVCL